ncbi:DNA cytosine methyltransferase [Pseudovibrio sp. Tun.PSC04-5.I4]|uniref:DNA cytosine methyltransferase n=1 Tax=Pseudovibrio sp. Tun.PSC04-5.I4 TaxID=1798213 RepID=UPI0008850DF2|nr:DNA cytosine methyltransferase [Pseudovibrio sp. Tun.PSC04-5.I4]SDR11165.1 DNA (cytosine-5)-methyltransferase 1 [Pseudovibrio sp. Tun.PSC04-5.I4]
MSVQTISVPKAPLFDHMNMPLDQIPTRGQELIIDAFAGGGGASTGIEMALRHSPDIAINHCVKALAMHAQNHPDTIHLPESVWEVDLMTYTNGRPVGLLWASPDCRHFSRARGSKPTSKSVRMLAWSVVNFSQKLGSKRPRIIILENVPEFQGWEDFDAWKAALNKLGYNLEFRILRACDYGAPTIRKRLFMIARRDRKIIRWPAPTHGDPGGEEVKAGKLLPWKTAADCIDWSIPCPSIFERKRPLVDNTMSRIAADIKKFVLDTPEPFILNMSHSGSLEPLTKPFSTIKTEKGGCRALVVPYLHKYYGPKKRGEVRGHPLNEPAHTVTTENRHALVAAFLAQHNFDVVGRAADAPLSTITARATQQTLVTSHLIKLRGTCRHGQTVTEPMPTLTAGGNHAGEVRAFLTSYYGSSIEQVADTPLGTVTTRDRHGLVCVDVGGEPYIITDIGMRMLTPAELYRAQGFPDDYRISFDYNGKPFPKTEQTAKCGNSVCPPVAKAIVEANLPECISYEVTA